MSATHEEPGDCDVDVRVRPDALWYGCLPARIPPGRWPADLNWPLAAGQQFAVNEIVARLGTAPGRLAVSGLPGAGTTTLLRDLIAAVVVARAERLAKLASPAEAFDPGTRHRGEPGHAGHAVTPLNPALTGREIVVASPDNDAAANVSAELAGAGAVGSQWREGAARLDYFGATARLAHGDGAWAMITAKPGDPAGQRTFPGLRAVGSRSWDDVLDEFLSVRERVRILAAERTEAALALPRLSALRREAATAYASIAAVEDALRTLAGQRVAAERSLRAAARRRAAAAQALEAHARAKPGLRAQLSSRFGAGPAWRARQGELEAALRDRAAPADTAQRALEQARAQFTAAVRAQAEGAAVLRRLTAECAEAQEEIARARQRWGEHCPRGPEFFAVPSAAGAGTGTCGELAAPWADPEFAATRTELFLAALALHKALVAAQADRIGENLNALADFLRGASRPGDRALLAAWQTLFLVVPALSTTLASLPALFSGLDAGSVGWLLIHGAARAPSQLGPEAIWRARRTVIVGKGGRTGL
jgi:hypothetical protein